MVAGITIMFALTFTALVWLARDVDRGISNRSAAHSIAFQSARAGAQAAAIPDVRAGDVEALDPAAARAAALGAAEALFSSYGVAGTVTAVGIDGDRVVVTVQIVDGSVTVSGTGIVEAERAP